MNRRSIVLLSLLIIILLLGGVGYFYRDQIKAFIFRPTSSTIVEEKVDKKALEVVAKDLVTPWSINILPNGDMLVSERSGYMQRLGKNGQSYEIEGVRETSEGGLLGVALHPDFEKNQRLYLYFTTDTQEELTNRIDAYKFADDKLTFERKILADIPAADNHNGGAIAFGPDKKLYVTTGDAAQPELAQDRTSLAGKILRMNDDGSAPTDNPYGNLVWSYGHRNPQGIAWDENDQLWSVEHGPSGADSGRDELNFIESGGNYGWPVITGDETQEGMRVPVIQSGDSETWAPAGMAYIDGSLYFAGLRGQSLYRAKVDGETVSLTKLLSGAYGRLRAVTAHDERLYISTSNRDGRGTPVAEDDRIFSIDPKRL